MAYTFDFSKSKDEAAVFLGTVTFALGYLSGISVKASLLYSILAGAGVVGYTGVVPKA